MARTLRKQESALDHGEPYAFPPRPSRWLVGHVGWHDVLFLHWRVDPAMLKNALPSSLKPCLHEGAAYVSITALQMVKLRTRFAPSFIGLSFPEVDVRTYVVDREGEPGVYFMSADAHSMLASAGARLVAGLPYHPATVRHSDGAPEADSRWEVKRMLGGATLDVSYRVEEWMGVPRARTLEHFLIEPRVLFAQKAGLLWKIRVHHVPYVLHNVRVTDLQQDLLATTGLTGRFGRSSCLSHFSRGVEAELYRPELAVPVR